jgi:hypothetical protein
VITFREFPLTVTHNFTTLSLVTNTQTMAAVLSHLATHMAHRLLPEAYEAARPQSYFGQMPGADRYPSNSSH